MKDNDETTNQATLSAPIEFWRALRDVRNYTLATCRDEYLKHVGLPPKESFRTAFDIVDNYLHLVDLDGWFDSDE